MSSHNFYRKGIIVGLCVLFSLLMNSSAWGQSGYTLAGGVVSSRGDATGGRYRVALILGSGTVAAQQGGAYTLSNGFVADAQPVVVRTKLYLPLVTR